jgi:hypothetical protein
MQNGPNLELEEMRCLTLQGLRYYDSQSDNTNNYPDKKTVPNLKKKLEKMIFQKYPNDFERYANNNVDDRMNENNRNKFLEVIHGLYVEGVIIWGNAFDSDTDSYPYFSITSYGKKVLDAGEIIPHDLDHYLTNLKSRIPNLHDLVLIYIQESIQCYLKSNLIASSVMLGVASEAVFMQLYNWFFDNATNAKLKDKLSRIQKRNDLRGKFDIVYGELEREKNLFEVDIRDNMETNLNGIFQLIRLQRNDSGHPTGKLIPRYQLFIYLNIFPAYCECVYSILDKLEKIPNKKF